MSLKISDKDIFRKGVYNSRSKIEKNMKQNMDNNIFHNLISSKKFRDCNKLFIYVSKPLEVDTLSIINFAFKEKKTVLAPKCNQKTGEIYFYEIKSFNDLEKSNFQIYEPIIEKCKKIDDYSRGICIVPGLCFDKFGYRMGYGKGYYDKFLKNFNGTKIGICYSSYIFEKLPKKEHDEKVDILITEKNIREVSL